MATWVTHLRIADAVLEAIPELCRHEFCVGCIAPDCNVENADWTAYTPPREVTHWMSSGRKTAADCDRFVQEYMKPRPVSTPQEESFLLGYYAHLIADAEFQRTIRDDARVAAAWERIRAHPKLGEKAAGLPETWDAAKTLFDRRERIWDMDTLDRNYLDGNPSSGYLTEIVGLSSFPDYLDYLPAGAIPRKVKVMGGIPEKAAGRYPFVAFSMEEYNSFIERTITLTVQAVRRYLKEKENSKS